ncbi:MAG: hypothetical protein DMG60_16320 [Acidobacteria bacterium]|nr:MAG: hypothetical protein DMG60_16320 [Acidobacteriota bacterium]
MLKLICRWLLALSVGLLAVSPAASQDFVFATNQLSAQVSQVVAPTSVSVAIRNLSSLDDATVSSIQAGIVQALQSRGWRIGSPQASEVAIAITLGESFRNYVWTAEIAKAASREVRIVELAKPSAGRTQGDDPVTLSRYLLISSETPLLDITLPEGKIGEGAHLLALSSTATQLFQLQSTQWRLLQTQPLGQRPLPSRDARGRIAPGQIGSFDAYLPGVHCTGNATSTLTIGCRESDDPWPLTDDRQSLAFYAPSRNYFNGVLSSPKGQSGTVNAFFSAAVLSDRVVFANVDGHASMAQSGRSTPISERWGSAIAAIQSSCRTDLVLASGAGDFQQADSLAAYEMLNSQFRPVSEPMQFAGPLLSLKTAPDRQQAIAIAVTPSGRYEAYLLTARCGT